MESIFEMSGDLNRVVAYYNQDENTIDGSYYHATRLGASQKYLLETRCGLTTDLLEILFSIKRGEAVKDVYDVSDDFIVSICSSDNLSPSHTFIYLDGMIYHSYALKYTLRCLKMNKIILKARLGKFLSVQNEENWKAITKVCEHKFSGDYKVEIINIAESNVSQAQHRTKKLLEDALKALNSGENCYDYDDYLYVLTFGTNYIEEGKALLCKLIERLNKNFECDKSGMDLVIWRGFSALKKYVDENSPNEFPSSCWTSAGYFLQMCGINEDPEDSSTYPNVIIDDTSVNNTSVNNTDSLKSLDDGVYHFTQHGDYEFHFFVVIVKGSKITLVQTYGGIDVLTVKEFDKNEWIDNYVKASKGDSKAYRTVFDIPRDVNLDGMQDKASYFLAYRES